MRDAWTGRTVRLLVLLGALLGVPIAGHAAAHPDIVFILTDDMSYADLAVMPHTRKLLNDQGTAFRRAYVNVSLCCPSRATILTGRYAQNTGVHRNGGTGGGYKAFVTNGNEEETIGVALSAAGYRTALIGKYINGYPGSDRSHVPPGWSDWAAGMDDIYQQFDYKLNVNGHEEAHGHAAADYAGDVFAGKALDFIDTSVKARKPYFLYLALISPHSPAAAAPRHDKLFPDARVPRTPSFLEVDVSDKPPFYRGPILSSAQIKVLDEAYRRRLRSLQSVDEAVAAIYARLKALGRLDDTYIVFTSDNGFRLGDHRLGIGKETGYEQDIHVPLIVRGPHVPAGRRTDALVDNADLAPTFAAWAGAKPPPDVDGRSLTPLLGGRKPGKWRTSLPVAHWPDSSFVGLDEAEGIFKSLPTPRGAGVARAALGTLSLHQLHERRPRALRHRRRPLPVAEPRKDGRSGAHQGASPAVLAAGHLRRPPLSHVGGCAPAGLALSRRPGRGRIAPCPASKAVWVFARCLSSTSGSPAARLMRGRSPCVARRCFVRARCSRRWRWARPGPPIRCRPDPTTGRCSSPARSSTGPSTSRRTSTGPGSS